MIRRVHVFGGLLVVAMLVLAPAASIWIAPDYLAYFNLFAGGPDEAHHHLVDSSLDWGQDLPTLKRWLDANGLQGATHPPVYLSFFGTANPADYRIDARYLPSYPGRPTDGPAV